MTMAGSKFKIKKLKNMTKPQKDIYDGLSKLSAELSAFYRDAVLIMGSDCPLESKVNLVAHLSREIDGGFRQIFAHRTPEEVEESKRTGQGHRANIIKALGFSNPKIAKEWFDISGSFAGFAHRHGVTPKKMDEFEVIWKRYEKVLSLISGSTYALVDRVNQITAYEEPIDLIIASVKQIMKEQQYEFQFYNQLDKPKWLPYLINGGFFEETSFPTSPEAGSVVQQSEWLPLRYLEKISGEVDFKEAAEVLKVITAFEKAVLEGRIKVDDYSISLIVKIWSKLKDYTITESNVEILKVYNTYAPRDFRFYEGDLTQFLLKRYIEEGSKDGLIRLLRFTYGFHKEEVFWEGQEDPFLRYYPNVGQIHLGVVNASNREIVAIGGKELLVELIRVLDELEEQRPMDMMSISSVEPTEQRSMRAYDWEAEIVDFIRDGIESLSEADRREFVEVLFKGKSHIGWRLALNAVNVHFEQLEQLFWDWISVNPLQVLFPSHELYVLLKARMGSINMKKFGVLREWLENNQFVNDHLGADEIAMAKREQVRRYLNALLQDDEGVTRELDELRKKYEDENSYKNPHPEFDDFVTVSYGFDLPKMPEGFKEMPLDKMVEFLSQHVSLDRFNDVPRGLGEVMNSHIIDDPQKYIHGLGELGKLPAVYLKQFVGSFARVVKNGFQADWMKILAVFMNWSAHYATSPDPEKRMGTLELGEFLLTISQGYGQVGSDKGKLEDLANAAISLLENSGNKSNEKIDSDLVSHMLNSGHGKLFEALRHFNGLYNKDVDPKEVNLMPQFKDYLTRSLERSGEKDNEFSVSLGMYLPYLVFVEGDWVEANFEKIFPKNNELHLRYTLSGLNATHYGAGPKFFEFLRKHDLATVVLAHFQQPGPTLNRLLKLALTELFYHDKNAIKEPSSIIYKILANKEPTQLLSLVQMCQRADYVSIKELLQLWNELLQICEADPAKFKEAFSELAALISKVDSISPEVLGLVEKSFNQLDIGTPTYTLVRYLIKLPSDNPQSIAELLIRIWKKTGVRPFVTDDLKEFVGQLYQAGHYGVADELCNFVASLGIYALKEIFDANQQCRFE